MQARFSLNQLNKLVLFELYYKTNAAITNKKTLSLSHTHTHTYIYIYKQLMRTKNKTIIINFDKKKR